MVGMTDCVHGLADNGKLRLVPSLVEGDDIIGAATQYCHQSKRRLTCTRNIFAPLSYFGHEDDSLGPQWDLLRRI